ncbi:LysE family translocator [Marinimicrobium locisalis]|uniref:LysE family translocator n=1 Tax=Marinimicrobium locisalis TaxID=546022 RepID=UPI003221C74F
MNSYPAFVFLAALTIALPGPGVLMTISNAAQNGWPSSMAGVLGISLGVLIVAAISATGVGVILAKSALAFSVVKYLGALYLIYLGIKIWKTKDQENLRYPASKASGSRHFYEGILVSLSNPKSIVFFVSIFPQFINPSESYLSQLALLSLTFSTLILFIHMIYTFLAIWFRAKFFKQKGMHLLNKACGGLLVSFGVGLASSTR